MNLLEEPAKVGRSSRRYNDWAAAVRETQDSKLIDEIIEHGSEASRKFVSSNEHLTKSHFQTLYAQGNSEIRCRLVMNSSTPNIIFKQLWLDPSPQVINYFNWLTDEGGRFNSRTFISFITSIKISESDLNTLRTVQNLPTVMRALPTHNRQVAMKLITAAFRLNEYIDNDAIDADLMELIENDEDAFETALSLYRRVPQ